MGYFVYIVGALLSLLCGVLLLRAYANSRLRLLFWSGLCFLGLALTNALGFVDLALLPNVDLFRLRLAVAAASMLVLVYGLICGGEAHS